MVSLVRSPQRSVGGGFSFSTEGSIQVDDDEIRILQPVIGDESTIEFHPINTIFSSSIHLIITVCFAVTAIVVGYFWPKDRERCEPFYLVLYMQAAFWILTMVHYFYIRSRHHMLRVDGYLDFYLDMRVLYSLPAHTASLCSILLLVISTMIQQIYRELENECQPDAHVFSPVTYIGSVILVQAITVSLSLVAYIVRIRKFNKLQPPPDVQREEWLASLLDESSRRPVVGLREIRGMNDELLEKQADYIRYLREHNTLLSLKLLQLNARLTGDPDA